MGWRGGAPGLDLGAGAVAGRGSLPVKEREYPRMGGHRCTMAVSLARFSSTSTAVKREGCPIKAHACGWCIAARGMLV